MVWADAYQSKRAEPALNAGSGSQGHRERSSAKLCLSRDRVRTTTAYRWAAPAIAAVAAQIAHMMLNDAACTASSSPRIETRRHLPGRRRRRRVACCTRTFAFHLQAQQPDSESRSDASMRHACMRRQPDPSRAGTWAASSEASEATVFWHRPTRQHKIFWFIQ
jgi:hypothetical protein